MNKVLARNHYFRLNMAQYSNTSKRSIYVTKSLNSVMNISIKLFNGVYKVFILLFQSQLAEARDVKFTQTLTEPLSIGSHIICTGTPSNDLPW